MHAETGSDVDRNEEPPKRRIKVAVLVGALEVGGAELDIVRNFPRLNRDEFEVVVVSFGTRGALAPELERQGVRVIARLSESEQRESRILRYARVTGWVGRTFRDQEIDIAHFFLPHAYAFGMVACALRRRVARTVMSRLSLNFYRGSHPALSWLERAVLHRRVDIAIGNAQVILDELVSEGVDRSRVRLLHNGIDPEQFERQPESRPRAREAWGLDRDAFVVVAVGNLHSYKGHGDLIEACARIRDSLPRGWRLLIAGRDEQGNRARYERRLQELGLEENVSFVGACDSVAQLLLAGDVFAQPSHHEGLPNAIIEAMAASLPVIGTTVGGIPEVIVARSPAVGQDEATGWLVPPSDPDALGAALVEAALDAESRKRMGERASGRVMAEFSLVRSVAGYEAVYRELVP